MAGTDPTASIRSSIHMNAIQSNILPKRERVTEHLVPSVQGPCHQGAYSYPDAIFFGDWPLNRCLSVSLLCICL